MSDAATCPGCESKGRKVEAITLKSLLVDTAKSRLNGTADYRFCKEPTCDVVYFGEAEDRRFTTADVKVPVFQKTTDPSRFVCYCFEHTVAGIEAEVSRTGGSDVADTIGAKCKQGLDRCEEMNPQGACCLGNVRQVLKTAMAKAGTEPSSGHASSEDLPDCCAPEIITRDSDTTSGRERERNVGLWSAGGALVAAVLSSACCWLPLLLIAVGASAAGVAGFFEAYRLHFLGATALLLGGGFYFVYFRKPKCAPGDACEVPNPKLQRFNKIMLWVATAFVVAFAAFPNYVGAFFGGSGEPPAQAATLVTRSYSIEGMTCEGCTSHVETAIRKLGGVSAVEVSYPDKLARVHFQSADVVDDRSVITAVESVGYKAAAPEATR